nr:putative ribonuclease H-like domain-containing protein [Tanacetum cinerariifolium]
MDYDEVFASVARIEAIRLFLAYASFMGFTVYQLDVKSAFLYGTIDEEVYVMQPLGFQDLEFPTRVYKVEKVMYGLHQAPRAWYGTLSKYLLTNGFQMGTIDQTLFIRRHREDFIRVQVYVDDIIFGSSNPWLCREFEALLHEKFQMSAMVKWKLYDTCRVHHVTSKDKEIFMLVEKDYPLRKGLAIIMISYKLQVENYSQMANDLILKIYKIANCPRRIVGNEMHKAFPLPKQLLTAIEDKFPLLIQSDATADELCSAAEVKE